MEHLEEPFPLGSVTISGGVFGYGEVRSLAADCPSCTVTLLSRAMRSSVPNSQPSDVPALCRFCTDLGAAPLMLQSFSFCADLGAVPVECGVGGAAAGVARLSAAGRRDRAVAAPRPRRHRHRWLRWLRAGAWQSLDLCRMYDGLAECLQGWVFAYQGFAGCMFELSKNHSFCCNCLMNCCHFVHRSCAAVEADVEAVSRAQVSCGGSSPHFCTVLASA